MEWDGLKSEGWDLMHLTAPGSTTFLDMSSGSTLEMPHYSILPIIPAEHLPGLVELPGAAGVCAPHRSLFMAAAHMQQQPGFHITRKQECKF